MVGPLHRVIIFVADVQKCAAFYRDAFGFAALPSDEDPTGWIELETGGCRLAFHKSRGSGSATNARTRGRMNPHKIVFFARDVAAARSALVARGAKMGKLYKSGSLSLCDGADPEGHVFQISNRP